METTTLKDGDATHRGLTDFYPDAEKVLTSLLKAKKPFDTGWFSCKHEIRSARIARFDGGEMLLNVQASMDDGSDLIDTLIWEASGGNDFASSGWDAMDKAGLETEESKKKFQDELLEALQGYDLIFYENTELVSRQVKATTSFRRVCDLLGELEDQCEQELSRRYKDALQMVKERIENHRAYERSL